MNKISELVQDRVINRAIIDSASKDDYRISHLAALLDSEHLSEVLDDMASTLGRVGYRGTIYVEQDDIGNGLQDVASVRVNIEGRNGQLVNAPRAKKMGHSTIGILRRFPQDAS